MFTDVTFLRARTVEHKKRPLLGNDCVTCNNGITVGSRVFCLVIPEAIQSVPGAKINIPESKSIGLPKQKVNMYMYPVPNIYAV
jgi:hypothetical protein